jgi:hypothetical protein
MDLTDSQEDLGRMEVKKTEMTKKTSCIGLTNFVDSCIRLMSSTLASCQPPNSLFLPFPHISTLTRTTDLSEEDTSTICRIETNINDYILTPQLAQAKADDLCLLKVFQWLQDLRQLDGLSDTGMQPLCSIVQISS